MIFSKRLWQSMGALALGALVSTTAISQVTTRLVTSGGAATSTKIVPGGTASIDVRVDAPATPTIGAAFRLSQTAPLANGFFSITARSFVGSPYNDTASGTADAVVLAPASALLDADNNDNLGRSTVGLVATPGANNILGASLTLTANGATTLGTYTIQPTAGVSFVTDDVFSDYDMSGATYTIIVGQTLTVTKTGAGAGTVTSNVGVINCGATCSDIYPGSVVTLTATPGAGSTFASWSGAGCSGVSTCMVTMSAARAVTATFNLSATTVPGAPIIGVATPGNSQATVSFTPPVSNGGSPITSYTATCGAVTATNTLSPIVVTGLTNGTTYTCTVKATNSVGDSIPSSPSNSVTPNIVPAAPTIGTATAGNTQATVAFTASVANGGTAITGYTVTSNPAGGVDSNAGNTGLSHVITGLTNGTAYTFTVAATNAAGPSVPSSPSNSVTPVAPQTINFGVAPTIAVGSNGALTATGGASGNPVTFSSTTTGICTVSGTNGSTVTGVTAGTCTIAANQAGNSAYNAAPQATQSFVVGAAPNSTRLINLSTRGQVQTGDNVMIGGFIIGGASSKTVLIRAVGPNLANFGVPGVLANPTLQLFSGQTVISSNDDWGSAVNMAAIQASGLAPANSLESAILVSLAPGPYTAIVSGVGGGTGVGIVEVFEIDNPTIPLINISTRGQVQSGDNVMIGGFIIQGSASQTVLIRAVGPNLANFGVPGVLANPTLQLFSGQTVIASNDDWQSASNAAAIQATGLAPAHSLESAILITLAPGAYTAIVSGVGGATGVGIVEVFTQ